jgi:hypothetical protein
MLAYSKLYKAGRGPGSEFPQGFVLSLITVIVNSILKPPIVTFLLHSNPSYFLLEGTGYNESSLLILTSFPHKVSVRGKVTAGGLRMKSIRISCIEIDRRILKELWRGPRRET